MVLVFVYSRLDFGRLRKRFFRSEVSLGLFSACPCCLTVSGLGGPMHGLYGIGLISVLAPALSLIELQMPGDTRAMYLITVFVSLSTFLYIWLNLAGFDPAHTKGLTQRVFSSINSLWPAVTAMILLRRTSV